MIADDKAKKELIKRLGLDERYYNIYVEYEQQGREEEKRKMDFRRSSDFIMITPSGGHHTCGSDPDRLCDACFIYFPPDIKTVQ